MLTLLHMSDLHFGPHYVQQAGEALLRVAAELEPDIIVATGDFTERARAEEFETAWRFMARLPDVPSVVVPGNRDIPLRNIVERVSQPYRLYHRFISPDRDGVLTTERAVVVSVDTTRPRRTLSNGRMGMRQLDLCARAFRSVPQGAARIVAMHHHLTAASPLSRRRTLPHARRTLERLQGMGVELVLCGHGHHAWIGNSLDVHPGRDRDHGIVIANAGTATSRRGRAPAREKNTLNLIRIHEGAIRVTHYMYFAHLDAFAPASRHVFPRRGHDTLMDVAPGPDRSKGGASTVLPLRPRRAWGGRD